jgi:hypothetical protein
MARHVGIGLLVAASFVAGTFVPVAWSQGPIQGTGEFVVVNYMKVPIGGAAAYVALERDLYKASHQARVRDGKLKSWSLWQRRFGGTEDPYSFVTINTYSKWDDLDAAGQDYVQKANPGKTPADIQRQTQAAREIVRTEVWRVIDETR